MSFSQERVRTRLARLDTDEEFERDQLNFFHDLHSQTLNKKHQESNLDEPFIPPPDEETPTSVLLPPIQERKVSSRRRRQPIKSTKAFPSVPLIYQGPCALEQQQQQKPKTNSASEPRNDTHESQAQTDTSPLSSNENPQRHETISEQARSTFSTMSEQEIEAAQSHFLKELNSETVDFLKKRWQQRGFGESSNRFVDGTNLDVRSSSISQPSAQFSSLVTSITSSGNISSNNSGSFQAKTRPQLDTNGSNLHLSDIRESLFIPDGPLDEKEEEKLLWMTDAETPLPSEAELDRILQDAVEAMGPIASTRFDFDGRVLTKEEVQSLPTHLGLHHHGASPASAGYTLPDIFLLMRSTLVPQRVMALRLLFALLQKHGVAVSGPLVESGALALAFAPFPSPRLFYAALTNQIAYVDVVDALVLPYCRTPSHGLVPDMFFASRFYSPVNACDRSISLFDTLAATDCVVALTRIAFTNAALENGQPLAATALRLVRELVVSSDDACLRLLNDTYSGMILRSLATAVPALCSDIPLFSCDILAHVIVRSAWGNDEVISKIRTSFCGEAFLRDISNYLTVLLHDENRSLTVMEKSNAAGALRIMRATLTFQHGVMPTSLVTQAICRVLYENANIATEAYLVLEAYIHCLHEYMTQGAQNSRGLRKNENPGGAIPSDSFIMDQISGLVPAALTACKRFTSENAYENTALKAAAGHFASTLFAIYRIPFDASLLALIFKTCSNASSILANMKVESVIELNEFQSTASVSHAGARLLTRVKMDPAYVRREVRQLLKATSNERQFCLLKEEAVWRPVANACAEWLGLLATVDCDGSCVEMAIGLISFLSDIQVIIDLLSRCVLRVDSLRVMNNAITEEIAQNCALELLPVAFDGLCELSSNVNLEKVNKRDNDNAVMISIFDIMKLWTEKKECLGSFVHVSTTLFSGGLLDASKLFDFLLRNLSNFFEDEARVESIFRLLFRCGLRIVSNGQKLISDESETKLSSTSTTPNPALAEAILKLAMCLVSRDPYQPEMVDGCLTCDSLSSVVLSFILRNDADVSLRAALWQQTINACGGAILFSGAKTLGDEMAFEEDEQMLYLYVGGIQRGFLDGNRCPQFLGKVLIEKLAFAIQQNPNGNALHLLRQVLQKDEVTSRALKTFSSLLQLASESARGALTRWQHNPE